MTAFKESLNTLVEIHLATPSERARVARIRLQEINSDERRWSRSIPPQGDDSDLLLSYIVDEYERMAAFRISTKLHELKTWPVHFSRLIGGQKQFELRKNDRDFECGDILQLREWDPETTAYTGRFVFKRVAMILRKHEGLANGYVIMGLLPA